MPLPAYKLALQCTICEIHAAGCVELWRKEDKHYAAK